MTPSYELLAAALIVSALVIYALTGGADFGGGVWDLWARGPRARQQREAIDRAIGPIWEANHVWLIVVVVVLFVAFPRAFALITTALHIPLTLMLIGVVLRGTSFVFRAYGMDSPAAAARWGRVFGISSTVAPLFLGVCLGAVAGGTIEVDPVSGALLSGFVASWLAPFPLAIGGLTLAMFSFLAAVYLVQVAAEEALKADFRRRGIGAGVAVGAFALLSLAVAGKGNSVLGYGLTAQWWSLPFHLLVAVAAIGAFAALWLKRDRWARRFAIGQVVLMVSGWAAAQYPYLVVDSLMLSDAAAPASVLRPLLIVFAVGAVILLPSFVLLYRLFTR